MIWLVKYKLMQNRNLYSFLINVFYVNIVNFVFNFKRYPTLLGIHLDKHLNFDAHFNNFRKQLSTKINLINHHKFSHLQYQPPTPKTIQNHYSLKDPI